MEVPNILRSLIRKRRMILLLLLVMFAIYIATFSMQYTFMTTTTRDFKHHLFTVENVPPYINTSHVVRRPNMVVKDKSRVANVGYGSCSMLKASPRTYFKQEQYDFFTDKFVIDKEPVISWISKPRQQSFCKGRVNVFDKRFAVLNQVVLNPSKILNLNRISKGGEEVRNVLNQRLDKEDYKFSTGFLELNCTEGTSGIQDSYRLMKTVSLTDTTKYVETESRFTVAVVRGDYANLHNWARAVYNVLLILTIYNVQPKDAVVVFLDGHPFTNLDNTWENIFGTVKRVGHLTGPVWFTHLALGFDESDGLVSDFRRENSAYMEECRGIILQQHNLNPQSIVNCSMPTITLLIRRNAVFHPRNIEGKVGRKIYNEAQLIDALMTAFPGACVQGVLMESLPMKSQLQIISQTDVMIGMHGAGMTHSLFLPQHAAILELFQKDFKRGRPWFVCYQAIARWRGLGYDSWENLDKASQMPHDFTIVPVDIIVDKTKQLVTQICRKHGTP